jgi:hypothetical protein
VTAESVSARLKASVPVRTRRQLAALRVRLRTRTADLRSYPDLLVIGAQRSGTSSVYKYLGAHPDVIPSLRKEVEYFSTSYERGDPWYRAHFPLEARRAFHRRLTGRRPVAFEATPDYLLDPRAPRRAAETVPGARIVALLRNPADRAFSHYLHMRRLGLEPLDFALALDQEEERLRHEHEKIAADPFYKARPLRRYSYVERGRYAEQLARWLAVYPRESLLVLRFEDFTAAPAESLQRIEAFIGIDQWAPRRFANHSYRRNTPAVTQRMSPSDRRRLEMIFDPLNAELAAQFPDILWDEGARLDERGK